MPDADVVGQLDIDIYRGQDWEYTLYFYDYSATPDLATYPDSLGYPPLSRVGYTYASQVRETPDSTVYETIAIDQSHLAAGYIVLSLARTVTAAMVEDNFWDIDETKTSTDKCRPLMAGRFTVIKDVTR